MQFSGFSHLTYTVESRRCSYAKNLNFIKKHSNTVDTDGLKSISTPIIVILQIQACQNFCAQVYMFPNEPFLTS